MADIMNMGNRLGPSVMQQAIPMENINTMSGISANDLHVLSGERNKDTFGSIGKEEQIRKEIIKISEQAAKEEQSQTHIIELSAYIDKCWKAARDAKQTIQRELYESGMQRNGKYSDNKLAELAKFSGSMVYMNLTSVKCRAAEAWVKDVLSTAGEEIWDIEPTPIPELDPNLDMYITDIVQRKVMEAPYLMSSYDDQKKMYDYLYHAVYTKRVKEAELAAKRMKRKINDQLKEAGWRKTLEEVVSDIITYKAGILKGPLVRRKQKLEWVQDIETGTWNPKQELALIEQYDRVSPFDIYPSPTATNINDGYLIEHHRMTRNELNSLIGVAGYSEDAIRGALRDYGRGGLKDWLWEVDIKEETEGRNSFYTNTPDNTIDAIEFWGEVQGSMLVEWGMDESEIEDPDKEYSVSAWKVGEWVIKAVINSNPTGDKPYCKTSYEKIPGSWWGHGVPELMKDIQEICNGCARALVNNLAVSSGPQVVVDTAQLESDQDVDTLYPWKIWYVRSDSRGGASRQGQNKAVDFFNPNSNANELLAVYNSLSGKADDYTGIPPYTYGSGDVSGAGKTASGLSMLMSNASKGIRYLLGNIDGDVVEPSVTKTYIYNMVYSDDPSIKGDLKVIARGTLSLIAKEQTQMRRIDFMNMLANNPVYLETVGQKGIASLLREVVSTLDMPYDDIIPSEEQIELNDMKTQIIQQLSQLGQAFISGQLSHEEFMQYIMQIITQIAPQQNQQQSGQFYKGTPANPVELAPDGSVAGGRDANLFIQGK